MAEHYRRRMLLLVVADDHEVDEEEVALLRRLHAQHEILWVAVEDADPTTTAPGATAYDVADAAVLPPQLRLDRRLARAYALAVDERRETLARTLERLGIVHVRVGSSDAALAAVFRLLERQRRRGR